MSAELDRNDATGEAAVFTVGDSAWHREGINIQKAPSFEQALVIAGVDWQVDLFDLGFRADPSAEWQSVGTGHKVVVRTDHNAPLGVVGSAWTPLQNRDAFAVLEPLVDQGVASFETGGSLRDGKDTWMMIRYNFDDPVIAEVFNGEVVPFGLVVNNHSGQRRVIVQETPIRVVCANTLGAALRRLETGMDQGVGVRHTLNVASRTVEAAEEMFGDVIERYRAIAEQYKLLKQTYLEQEQFKALVQDVIAPLPKYAAQPDLKSSRKVAVERAEDRRAEVARLWTEGAGHTGDQSAWEAYNGTVQMIDHDTERFNVKLSRTQALFSGRLGGLKQRVLDGLVAYAETGEVAETEYAGFGVVTGEDDDE